MSSCLLIQKTIRRKTKLTKNAQIVLFCGRDVMGRVTPVVVVDDDEPREEDGSYNYRWAIMPLLIHILLEVSMIAHMIGINIHKSLSDT